MREQSAREALSKAIVFCVIESVVNDAHNSLDCISSQCSITTTSITFLRITNQLSFKFPSSHVMNLTLHHLENHAFRYAVYVLRGLTFMAVVVSWWKFPLNLSCMSHDSERTEGKVDQLRPAYSRLISSTEAYNHL